ncbi:hypothetical protein L6164_034209 [Bauhinia variegata]|uniref:Uncharacterized protein n=1 Tax=Bauhinia variegata TaxID=167791 RepID=A0ACB9KUB8_BAUVA|nr:hypothetical protein L6164_034209 [Bauhinia variegata]
MYNVACVEDSPKFQIQECIERKMGQSLKKLAPGSEEKKLKEIGPIIDKFYDDHFAPFKDATYSVKKLTKEWSSAEFYRAVCCAVEKINEKLGNTQFRVPTTDALREAYHKHHQGKGRSLTREEFQKILEEVITDTGFTGIGAKDTLLYIFGVPVTALFLKQRVMPQALPNEIFIPGVTSVTVLVLAMLNKI